MWWPGHPQDARHTPVVQKAFWLWDVGGRASPSPCRVGDGVLLTSLFCCL